MNKLLVGLLMVLPSLALASHSNHLSDVKTSIVSIGEATDQCLSGLKNFTNAGMINCLGDASAAYDNLLNSEYQKVMSDSEISQDEKDLLKRSSDAWVVYKDAQCKWVSPAISDTAYTVQVISCLSGLTSERITEIAQRHY